MKKVVLTIAFLLFTHVNAEVRNIKLVQTNLFSEENLIIYMEHIGIAYPEIALAQAKLETGGFTSKICNENNNLFGMKLPRQRETTAIGEKYNHAEYTSWRQSVMDYKLWQDRIIHKLRTKKKYLNYISRNYAEDGSYIRKINKIIN